MGGGSTKNRSSLTESETDSEAEPSSLSFPFPPKPQPKPRRPKSDDEKRRIAERRVVQEREREASRPYHQFVYQISKDCKRIPKESGNGEGADAADMNTRAYENVKNTWTKRGIWNGRWGMPGILWKLEEPLEEEAADDPAPVPADPLVNGGHEAEDAPAIRISGRRTCHTYFWVSFSRQIKLSPGVWHLDFISTRTACRH